MKEANCLERGMRPTLNEPDDLRRSTEPELIAGLNLPRAALEMAHCAALEKVTSSLLQFTEIKLWRKVCVMRPVLPTTMQFWALQEQNIPFICLFEWVCA